MNNQTISDIQNMVRNRIASKGMSVDDLAIAAEVVRSTIFYWLSDKRDIQFGTIFAIFDVLKIRIRVENTTPENISEVKEMVQNRRKNKGITFDTLADQAGVSRATILAWLNKPERDIQFSTLLAVFNVLKIRIYG